MDWIQTLIAANRNYQIEGPGLDMSARPALRLAVVTCMDVRIDPLQAMGLGLGDAHIIRNAGARVTDDVIRSLAISQQALGTERVLLMPHTRCGLIGLEPSAIVPAHPEAPAIDMLAIQDLQTDLSADLAKLKACGWLKPDTVYQGALFDIDARTVRLVEA